MTTYTIPLNANVAYQKFSVTLSDTPITMRISYLASYQYFVADVYVNSELKIAGRGLHPNIDLLQGLKLGIGTLYLRGKAATISNLGVDNTLVFDDGE